MHKFFFIISLLYASTCFEHCCAHHQEVKIVLYSIWYRHTCRWLSGAQVETVLSQPVHRTATYSVWRYQMLYNTILTSWWWTQQSGAQVETVLSQPVHRTATYRVWRYQMLHNTIWPPGDEHNSPVHRLRQSSLNLCTGRPPTACDDTRCCIIKCWPPDDEHMCSKHVEAWSKLIVKQKVCASSWLITEINIPRCTVSKTSKNVGATQSDFNVNFKSLSSLIKSTFVGVRTL